jgi:hypothetical protein
VLNMLLLVAEEVVVHLVDMEVEVEVLEVI